MTTTGYDRLYEALGERGLIVSTGANGNVRARCPAHGDTLPSLSVDEGDNGFPLAFCHAGCTWHDICEALDLKDLNGDGDTRDRIVAQYIYTDESGEPLYRVLRRDPKGFHQERWTAFGWTLGLKDTRKVLYDLPEVIKAVANGTPIYLVEGEKDVETFKATQTGAVATCFVGGAGKWSPEATSLLLPVAGTIVLVGDRDAAGRKHVNTLLSALPGASVRWPAEGKDFTDHVYAGFGLDELLEREPIETDWDDWDEAIPEFDWLVHGILARGTLVWAYGPKESAKSMYLLDICTRLSHQGVSVTYYSEEMARTQDKRRIARFGPNKEFFHWKNGRGLDLSNDDHVGQIIEENRGNGLVVFDSYERVYDPPISNENKRAVAFARIAHHIIVETGATVVVIDHTGFGYRDESGNLRTQRQPRGASAKEQQADMAILFEPLGKWRAGEPYKFRIENMKPGRLENPFTQDLEVVDTTNGGLAVVMAGIRTPISGEVNSQLAGFSTPSPDDVDGESVVSGSDSAGEGPLPVPASLDVEGDGQHPPLSTPQEQRRIRELLRQGKSRNDAHQVVLIERALA